jgi:hypothetical protein
MSRLVVSKICFRNILFCCFSFLALVLFVNRLSLNDFSPTVLANLLQTELSLEIQQLERQNLLHEKCRETIAAANNQPKRSVTTPATFKADDRHRVMYCDVPKVKNNYRQNKNPQIQAMMITNRIDFSIVGGQLKFEATHADTFRNNRDDERLVGHSEFDRTRTKSNAKIKRQQFERHGQERNGQFHQIHFRPPSVRKARLGLPGQTR